MVWWSKSERRRCGRRVPDQSTPDRWRAETSRIQMDWCAGGIQLQLPRAQFDREYTNRPDGRLYKRTRVQRSGQTIAPFPLRSDSTWSDRDCPTHLKFPGVENPASGASEPGPHVRGTRGGLPPQAYWLSWRPACDRHTTQSEVHDSRNPARKERHSPSCCAT